MSPWPICCLSFAALAGLQRHARPFRLTVYTDIEPGEYEVVLGGPGHGSKIVHMEVRQDQPHQFRLLSDGLLGYMWPKCVRGGERAEFRVHGVVEYELELWRYGAEKEFIRRIGTC